MKRNVTSAVEAIAAISMAVTFMNSASIALDEKDRPAKTTEGRSGDELIAELLSKPKYTPLPGQIAVGVDQVSKLNTALAGIANAVPAGDQGQASPWFTKLLTLRGGLGQLAVSKLQDDIFAQIPRIAEFYAAEGAEAPAFVSAAIAELHVLDTTIIFSIKAHVAEQDASITAVNLTRFINFFSTDGFVSEANWEDESMPIDASGIIILDPASVVAQLKAQPWQNADRFVGDVTSAEAFVGYENAGTGLAVLKTKYAANKAAIIAKWDELAAWVAQQRGTN